MFLFNLLLPLEYPLHMPLLFIFTTHLHDPILRLPLMTPFRDSHSQPPFMTRVFMSTLLCDPTTDGWTMSTPQHHLPSVLPLTLIKMK